MVEPHQHVIFVVALVVSGIAAFFDWRKGEIPNWLTYGAILIAPLLHVIRFVSVKRAIDLALLEGGFSLAGAVACALVPALLYRQGAIGGGDVKLCATLGALLQTRIGIEAELCGFLAATLMAPAKLAYEGKLFAMIKNSGMILFNVFMPKAKRRSVDESALSWFRLGPPLFLGVGLSVYMHW